MQTRLLSLGGGAFLRFAAITLLFASCASASEFLVYNNEDSGAGSLRQAIIDSNTQGGINTIVFSNNVTGTITLTSGELLITANVTIRGPGPAILAVNGNAAGRVFHTSNVIDAFVFGLTISNGLASGSFPGFLGGAIWNDHSRMTLSNCVVTGNRAGSGGAIYNDGSSTNRRATLRVMNSTISSNSATGNAGAIHNYADQGTASVSIATSTLYGNSTTGSVSSSGGAIFNDGNFGNASLSIGSTTISGNSARGSGGAIFSSGAGGGNASVGIETSTFSSNSAPGAGGVFINGSGGTATCSILNSIFKTGASGVNIANNGGTVSSTFGYNLSNDGASGLLTHPTDQINTDPLLGPLADNGGPTLTHALLPGSPAIDKGSSFGGTADQRGQPRPFEFPSVANAAGGDGSDIGAFEVGRPQLGIQIAGNNAVLSWPAYSAGFILFFSSDPAAPFSWITAGGFPVRVGSQYYHTNGPIADRRYFRLRGN